MSQRIKLEILRAVDFYTGQSRLLGLFPLDNVRGGFVLSKYQCYYSALVCLFYSLLTFYFVTQKPTVAGKLMLSIPIDCLDMLMMHGIALVSLGDLLTSMGKFNNCLEDFQDVASFLSAMGRRTLYIFSRRHLYRHILFATGAATFRLMYDILNTIN